MRSRPSSVGGRKPLARIAYMIDVHTCASMCGEICMVAVATCHHLVLRLLVSMSVSSPCTLMCACRVFPEV